MIYYGKNNTKYDLGKALKSGGEGTVYQIENVPGSVAKIYKPERLKDSAARTEMQEKLEAMLAANLSPYDNNGNLIVAWPTDCLYDSRGEFQGFVMPFISNKKSILWVYRESDRQVLFNHQYHWKKSVGVAYNLAVTVNRLHQAGIVIGDFNSNNILVDSNGIVTLIDTDSFNVTAPSGKVFKCNVGVPEMLPPELQGKNLSKPENQFTFATDRFSLAIHIFMLLCNNCHPFNCVDASKASSSCNSPLSVKNITKGYCPYVTGSGATPPAAPDMAFLPLEIRNLFDRVFKYDTHTALQSKTINSRPTAEEWLIALGKLYQSNMIQCRVSPQHRYPAHYSAGCPWCAVEQKKAAMGTAITRSSAAPAYTPSPSRPSNHARPSHRAYSSYHKRPVWPLYLICIAVGILGATYPSDFICRTIWNMFDFSISPTVVTIIMAILGLISGASVALVFSYNYESKSNGWVWLLSSLLAPVAALLAAAVITLVIALVCAVVGAVLSVLGTIILAILLIGGICSG